MFETVMPACHFSDSLAAKCTACDTSWGKYTPLYSRLPGASWPGTIVKNPDKRVAWGCVLPPGTGRPEP